MWSNTLATLKRRMDKVERVSIPQWLETLTTEELWKVAGFPRRDDMLLLERAGVPPDKRRPFDTLSDEQLIRIANGEDLVTVFEEDSNIQ